MTARCLHTCGRGSRPTPYAGRLRASQDEAAAAAEAAATAAGRPSQPQRTIAVSTPTRTAFDTFTDGTPAFLMYPNNKAAGRDAAELQPPAQTDAASAPPSQDGGSTADAEAGSAQATDAEVLDTDAASAARSEDAGDGGGDGDGDGNTGGVEAAGADDGTPSDQAATQGESGDGDDGGADSSPSKKRVAVPTRRSSALGVSRVAQAPPPLSHRVTPALLCFVLPTARTLAPCQRQDPRGAPVFA